MRILPHLPVAALVPFISAPVRASAIKTALRCWRKVRFDDLYYTQEQEAAEPDLNTATGLGTAVHKVAELWHLGARGLDLSRLPDRIFETGLRFNPPPGTHAPELKFTAYLGGVPYSGTMDLQAPGSVVDHKTSTNPAAWGLTEESMQECPQVLLYCMVTLYQHGICVRAKWIYYPTKGGMHGKALKREVYWEDDGLEAAFIRHVHPTAEKLHRLRVLQTDPNSLPANRDACYDFNRQCDHWHRCAK